MKERQRMMNFLIPRSVYLPLLALALLVGACRSESSADAGAQRRAQTTSTTADTSAAESVVVVLGNSLAAGYGLEQGEAFPALLRQKADAMGWDVRVVNAGRSGDTSAGGLERLPGVLDRAALDVLVLELGGNDGLQGVDPQATKGNLAAIIDSTRARFPGASVVLTGLRLPPNRDGSYARRFQQIYPELAEAKNVTLVPSLMEGAGGVDSLMQADGIHPTAAGQRRIARNVWRKLKPILVEDCGAEKIAMSDTASMTLESLADSADTTGADCANPKAAARP
jgi:acyl-CoA thioesterase-1